MVVFSGFYESHEPSQKGNVRSIVPSHRDGIEMASKVGTFCIVILLIVALVAAGVIRSKWSPNDGIQWLPAKPWS